jgi:hypothetical protein
MNYNKLNFYGSIIGLITGMAVMIGLPFIILGQVPNYFILYLILGIMAFTVISLLGIMILLLARKNFVSKLVAPVLIPAMAAVIFFALITYQQLGPQLVPTDQLPYLDLINQLDPLKIFAETPFYATGIFFIFLLPLIIYFLKFQHATFFIRENILKNGLSGQAKIISVEDYGLKVNNEPVFKITLEINSPTQGVYQVTKDFYVPQFTLGELVVGTMVKVKIDPNNPKNVALDNWTGNV